MIWDGPSIHVHVCTNYGVERGLIAQAQKGVHDTLGIPGAVAKECNGSGIIT